MAPFEGRLSHPCERKEHRPGGGDSSELSEAQAGRVAWGGSLRLLMKRLDDAKDKMEALLNAAPGNVQVAEDHHVEGPLTEEDPASGDAADEGKEGDLGGGLREEPL